MALALELQGVGPMSLFCTLSGNSIGRPVLFTPFENCTQLGPYRENQVTEYLSA